METLKWLRDHSLKVAKILAVSLVAFLIVVNIVPKSSVDWLVSKLAFAEIRLPTPRQTPVAVMKDLKMEDSSLMRSGFRTLVQSISIRPEQEIKMGDTIYGYARTDLFDKEDGAMWVVVRRADGVPIATARAYTRYGVTGFGFVPFSVRVPALLTSGPCLLEFRRQDPYKPKLSDILFTSMPVTCVGTEVGNQ
jgi:hypothetical protein